jgi:hypothetical protein
MNKSNLNKDYLIINVYNKKMASGNMRGDQTHQELKKKYQYVYTHDEYNKLIINPKNHFLFKLNIVVFIYKWTMPPADLVSKLNNPYIIWDIIDGLDHNRPNKKAGVIKNTIVTYKNCEGYRKMYKLSNLINCANSKQMEILSSVNPLNKQFDCIPHNWDNRIRNSFDICKKNEKLSIPHYAFVGTSQQSYDKIFKNYYKFKHIANKVVSKEQMGTFNVCGSFRTGDQSIPKPGTKCAVAASMNCIFIANKDEAGVVDLLGPEYPYYFSKDPNKKHIKTLINYIDKTYKTEIWNTAMECVKDARIKSDVITTTSSFITHFTNHFNKL